MDAAQLRTVAQKIMTPGKGILATDGRSEGMQKRFESAGIEYSEELDKKFRSLFYTTEGIENYISRDNELKAFGSYNILKEEFISIEQISLDSLIDEIQFSQRIIDNELVDYRVLSYSLEKSGNNYLIEIGRSISTIIRFEEDMKRFAFLFLVIIIFITIILDLSFIQFLLNPFEKIVRKLKNTDHPTSFDYTEVQTSTSDFKYLDYTIHSLMHKIEDAFNNEREYISNVSHELLTPISIIQSKLDNILSDESLSDSDLLKIMDSKHADIYIEACDSLFESYSKLVEPTTKWLHEKYGVKEG